MAYDAGTAFISVVPSFRNFVRTVQQEMEKAGLAGAKTFSETYKKGVEKGTSDTPVGPSRDKSTKAGVDSAGSFADGFKRRLDAALKALPDVKIHADSSDADVKLAALKAELEGLSKQKVGVDVDPSLALAQVDRIRADLERLGAESASVQVKADTAQARIELDRLKVDVDKLATDRPTITPNADTAKARAELDALKAKADDAGSGVGGVGSNVSLLVTGLAAIAPAAVPAFAAIAAGAAAALIPLTGLAVSFGGLAAVAIPALKDLQKKQAAITAAQKQQAAVSGKSAAAEAASAAQQQSAEQSLGDARRQAAQSAVDAAERVSNAQRTLADAERTAAQQRIQVDQQLRSAEYAYAQSVKAVQVAEASLADARQQARRDLQNYANSQVDAGLAQKQSVLDLQTAQTTYDKTKASSTATDQQKAQALLDLQGAQQRLVEANQSLASSTQDNTKAQREGVAAAPGVVSAAGQVTQAKHSQQDAATSLANAERAVAQQQQQSAEAIAVAQQGVSDAVRSQARAQQQSAESIVKAQQQVVAAARAAGSQQSAALFKYKAAMDALSPSQRKFLANENALKASFKAVQKSVDKPLFALFNAGLKVAAALLPSIRPLALSAIRPLESLAKSAAKAFASPEFKSFVQFLAKQGSAAILAVGSLVGGLAVGFAGLLRAFAPLAPAINGGLIAIGAAAARAGTNLGKSSGFQHFLDYVRVNGPIFLRTLGNLATIVGHLAVGLAPLGHIVLTGLEKFTGLLASLSPGKLAAIAAAIGGVFVGMKAIAGLQSAFSGLQSVLGAGGLLEFLGLGATGAVVGVLAGIAVAVVAIGAGFIYLYKHSLPVRQLVSQIGATFTDLFRQAEPILKGIFQQAMLGVTSAVHSISRAVQQNKPQIDEMLATFKLIGGYIIRDLAPALGPVLRAAFVVLGGAIVGAIKGTVLLFQAFRFMAKVALTSLGAIIDAADNAFSVFGFPLSKKLHKARLAFDSFAKGVSSTLDAHLQDRTLTVTANGVITVGGRQYSTKNGPKGGAYYGKQLPLADGGPVPMLPGATAHKDSVRALLMPKEFVVREDGSNLPDAIRYYGWKPMAGGGLAGGNFDAGVTAYNDATNSLLAGLTKKALAAFNLTSGAAGSVIAEARKFLGVPYLWGGESPGGFDCSGLVDYVLTKLGLHPPRTAAEQQRWATPEGGAQARAGDLVFFGNPAHHVGIYEGGGRMIDAPHSGANVREENVWGEAHTFGRIPGLAKQVASQFVGAAGGGARGLGAKIAASMGYGNQFGAIDYIFSHESGWNPTAQNPTSTAYGIPQFLDSTWSGYGGKTSDPSRQIIDGIRYMVNRYGSPNGAEQFWMRNHYYDQGGYLPPGPSMVFNGTGKPEPVFTSGQWKVLAASQKAGVGGVSHVTNVYPQKAILDTAELQRIDYVQSLRRRDGRRS